MSKNQLGVSALSRFSGLTSRLMFLILALIVYRIGVHITLPGIDAAALAQLMEQQKSSSSRVVSLRRCKALCWG